MAFQTSPGVNISEIDLTNVVPAVATTEGAIAGVFRWGPELERILVTSEQDLVNRFGKPLSSSTSVESSAGTAETVTFDDVTVPTSGGLTTDTWTLVVGSETYVTAAGDYTDLNAVATAIQAKLTLDGVTTYSVSVISNKIVLTWSTVGNQVVGTYSIAYTGSGAGSADDAAPTIVEGTARTVTTSQWSNYETFFSAANFLSYSDALYVTRVVGTAGAAGGTNFTAKYKGSLGNSIQVSHCVGTSNMGVTARADSISIDPFKTTGTITNSTSALTYLAVGDRIVLSTGNELVVTAIASPTGSGNSYSRVVTFDRVFSPADGAAYNTTFSTQWRDADLFDSAPSSATRMHVVVRDSDGKISGTAGTILEVFEDIDTSSGSINPDGSTNYSPDVFENRSLWIACTTSQAGLQGSLTYGQANLAGGVDSQDESAMPIGKLTEGYSLYVDPADVDVSLIIQGKARDGNVLANHLINGICEVRKDCVAFISPELSDTTVADMTAFANGLTASTFAVVDSGYKYQYDKYSDVYRWIPLNADIAGLCARTDDVRDPWFSPAGYSRGNIKNVVKLRLNPAKAERDVLYRAKINPVITQPGQGTVLFGDKTFAPTTSAFDRINVRRLFIVLEKAIGVAAKSTLFEFNDDFTRAQFKNLVEPFLRDVQGRRGIYDFRVVCDETNNTSNVIDSNQFVGDIYIKPARSINFIQLNFVAVRSGVEFSEVVGQF
jgi:hypothetical protein